MNYIDAIFQRCDINGITNYLLYGEEINENNEEGYYERVRAINKRIDKWLGEYFSEFECVDKQSEFIYSILSETQSIYMQIGLRAGIMLMNDYHSKTKNIDVYLFAIL